MNDIDFQIICSFILIVPPLPSISEENTLSMHLLDFTERPESPLEISIIRLRLVSAKSPQ